MSSAQKTSAKARAKKAGRPYPNLVDNMQAAQGKTAGRKRTSNASKSKRSRKRK